MPARASATVTENEIILIAWGKNGVQKALRMTWDEVVELVDRGGTVVNTIQAGPSTRHITLVKDT